MSIDQLVDLIKSLDPKASKENASLQFEAFHKLAKRDPAKSLEVGVNLPPGFCTPFYFKGIVQTDRAAVANWIAENGLKDPKAYTFVAQGLRSLVQADPKLALEVVERGDGALRKRFGSTVLGELAKEDLSRALQAANGFPQELRAEAMKAALIGGAYSQPAEAFGQLKTLADPQLSSSVYSSVFYFWMNKDPEGAVDGLLTLSGPEIQGVLQGSRNILSKIVGASPDSAISVLNKIVLTESNASMFVSAMKDIAKADPAKPFAWLDSFPDSQKKREMVREVITVQAAADPASTLPELLQTHGDFRSEVLEGGAAAWARIDSAAALTFAKTLSTAEQLRFSDVIFQNSIEANPASMAETVAKGDVPLAYKASPEYLAKVSSVGMKYAESDLEKAVAWANTLQLREQEAAVSGVATIWAKKDTVAVSDWIASFPNGPVRTAAAKKLIAEIEGTDPEMAQRWKAAMGK